MTEQQTQSDLQSHARILAELTNEIDKLRTAQTAQDKADALRQMKDEYLDERLDRIEASIKSVYSLGKWVLVAFGTVLVSALATFVVRGGLFGP